MKAFSFRLRKLLGIRAAAEREQGRRLGVALAFETRARIEAEEEQKKLAVAAEPYEEGSRATTAGTLRNIGTALDILRQRAAKAAAAHQDAIKKLDEERDAYRLVRRERRILARLRDRLRDCWEVELSRAEQKQLDEIAGRMNHDSPRR